MSTSEVLYEITVKAKLKLLPDGITPPATVAALSLLVNELHVAGKLEKVIGGWKWVAPKVEPVVSQRELFA